MTKWSSQEEYDRFIEMVNNLNTPINIDRYVSEVIINTGEKYLLDEISLEQAVEKINIDLEVYLME